MQKRMFRDRYGLTDLVLSGQKTQTRDVIKIQDERLDYLRGWNLDGGFAEFGRDGEEPLRLYPKYYVGEVVAVAQSYQKAYPNADFEMVKKWTFMTESAGWKNKMFVRPDLMPHAIKITKIRFEKLQDISEEDCLKEGILKSDKYAMPYGITEKVAPNCVFFFYKTPKEAFAALIDKINGYGTWESNPYLFVYDFELVK